MKKFTTEQLKEMLKNIKLGACYQGIASHGHKTGKIYLSDNNFIVWEHFGSSANKANITELKWILNNIFNDCDTVEIKCWY